MHRRLPLAGSKRRFCAGSGREEAETHPTTHTHMHTHTRTQRHTCLRRLRDQFTLHTFLRPPVFISLTLDILPFRRRAMGEGRSGIDGHRPILTRPPGTCLRIFFTLEIHNYLPSELPCRRIERLLGTGGPFDVGSERWDT